MTTEQGKPLTPWNFERPQLDFRHRFHGYLEEARSLSRFVSRKITGRTQPPHGKFVIFGRGRSGSTLLVRYLDQIPGITCLGEILRERMLFPRAHRDRCLAMASGDIRGFKLLSYQLTQVHRVPPDNRYLMKMQKDGYRIIYLHRENLFRLAISNLYARLRGRFHQDASSRSETNREAFDFPPELILSWMEGAERRDAEERAMLEGVEHLELTYERDLELPENQQETVRRVCDWLGVKSSPVSRPLNRLTPKDLRQIISNYDQVIDRIRSTRFNRFVNSPA